MKKLLLIILTVLLTAGLVQSSEEDRAVITGIELTAQTTVSTFGAVVLMGGTTPDGQGSRFTSLAVIANGKKMAVPAAVLESMTGADVMSAQILSEAGYPARGIGPYLYVDLKGRTGPDKLLFRLTFDANGFVEMTKAAIR